MGLGKGIYGGLGFTEVSGVDRFIGGSYIVPVGSIGPQFTGSTFQMLPGVWKPSMPRRANNHQQLLAQLKEVNMMIQLPDCNAVKAFRVFSKGSSLWGATVDDIYP